MQEIIKEKISLLEERYERQSNIELKNHYLKPLSPRCKEYWKRQAEITKNRIDLLKDILRTKELENKLEEDKMEKNTIRKVHITYKMVRGANDNEVAETCIDLPISQERYDELAEVINGESEVWRTVREALLNLTYLQGYNKLGAWSIELDIDG